jgi:hypothetical protein
MWSVRRMESIQQAVTQEIWVNGVLLSKNSHLYD